MLYMLAKTGAASNGATNRHKLGTNSNRINCLFFFGLKQRVGFECKAVK